MAEPFEERMRRGGAGAVAEATSFFMKTDPVHVALRAIARRLDEAGVPYAVAGGMALVAHGYDRTTIGVDVLVTAEGVERTRQALVGFGYGPAFEGSRRQLRDTETGVRVEFLVTGEFPGDGRAKAGSFPEPATCVVESGGIRYLDLTTLLTLKLASGMTNPGRLKDLADVQELIRARGLSIDVRDTLHPYVRATYEQMWTAVQE